MRRRRPHRRWSEGLVAVRTMRRPPLIGWPATLLHHASQKRGHRRRPAGPGGGSPQPTVDQTCKCSTYVFWRFFTVVENVASLLSAASDVNPDQVAEQRTAEPAAVVEDAAPQATDQPATAAAATGAEGQSAPASAAASTPPRDGEATRTPPPSTVAEEEGRVPTPLAEEGRVPTPPRAGASLPVGSLGLDQGPVMPSTAAGGSAANKEPQEASDDGGGGLGSSP